MKYLLVLIVALTLLVNPVLTSYGFVQDKTYKLLADGFIQSGAKITCWEYDKEPKIHITVDVTNAFHLKEGSLMSAFIVDLTKNGPESYIQIGKPQFPLKEFDYIAFSDSFDSKNFRSGEPKRVEESTSTAEVNSIKIFVNTDKKEYNKDEPATIFFAFIDADDNFIDPDSINVIFNGAPIGDLLEKKKTGSFTYVTPRLQQGHNQITVIPTKAGFDKEVEAVTITIKGSMDLPSTKYNDLCPLGHVGRIVVVVGTSPPSDEDTLSKGGVDIIAATTSGTAETDVL